MSQPSIFKRRSAALLAVLLLSAGVSGCNPTTEEPEPPPGLTGLSIALRFNSQSDTAAIRYRLLRKSCAGESFTPLDLSVDKPLEEILLPGGIPGFQDQPLDEDSSHAFADLFLDLPPGCYDVTTQPLRAEGSASQDCAPASASDVHVNDGRTTELFLINQCRGDGRGAIDVISALNHPPALSAVAFERSKFVQRCEDQVVCATANDPDHDPIEFAWHQVGGTPLLSGPTVVRTTTNPDGSTTQCVRAMAEHTGQYQLTVAVYDLLHDPQDAERLIRFEEYFARNGSTLQSRVELTFPFYAAANGFTGSCIAPSCKVLLERQPGTPSGSYQIDPDGYAGPGAPFEAHCDMVTDGGGWTLIAGHRGGTTLSAVARSWIDLLSQNYYWEGDMQTSTEVRPDYHQLKLFALLRAVADMPFQQLRFADGRSTSVQAMASQRTLRAIHAEDGVEPLYRGGRNTGVLLLLGNAAHTSSFPCFYPRTNGLGCDTWFAGDSGNQTTTFYVGDLDLCSQGPAAGSVPYALWGSGDCYETNQAGGYAGFVYRRPIDRNTPYVGGGYRLAPWSLYVR